jgi:hypothetical protein
LGKTKKRWRAAVHAVWKNLSLALRLKLIAAGLAATSVMGAAHAATVFDTPLVDPPGVYFGSGNSNEGFTVSTSNGIELGLGVQNRKVGPVHPDAGTNIYHVNTGFYSASLDGCTGICAKWNFEFSLNLQSSTPNAGLHLSDVNGQFTILNVANGQTLNFSPTIFPDNAGWNGSSTNIVNSTTALTDFGAQNSENLGFSFWSLLNPAFGFDPNQDNTYIIAFSLFDQARNLLGSVDETIIAGDGAPTPLPAALPLFASGLGVIGFVARRRKKKSARITA